MGIMTTALQNEVLNCILTQGTWTAPVTGIKVRLDSTAPTAAASGTEIASGNGYTTGGTACAFGAASAGQASNTGTPSWTCALSGGWTIIGIELNDYSANRFLWGEWTGEPISVANGDTFAVSAGAIVVNAASW